MNLDPWERCEGCVECALALELNEHQVVMSYSNMTKVDIGILEIEYFHGFTMYILLK